MNRRKLFFLLALLTAVLLPSSAAADESDDPGHYDPSGQLFESPDLRNGHEPTLYEKYSDSSWNYDYKGHGMLDLKNNLIDGLLNGGASFFNGLNRTVVNASIDLYTTVSSFDMTPISEKIEVVLSAAGGSVLGWLLPSALALGGIGALAGLARGTGEGLGQIGAVAACAIFAISIVKVPDAWTEATNAPRELGTSMTSAATSAAVKDLHTPFDGPKPTFGSNEKVNAQRRTADAIWRTYVASPWCLGEFGSYKACKAWGEELLKRNFEDRSGYIMNTINDKGGEEAKEWIIGHEGGARLTIAFFSLLASLIFCGVIIFLSGLIMLFMILTVLMLIVGVVILMLGCIPGRPRQWAVDWFWKLVSFTLVSFIVGLVLMATILIAMITMSLTGTYGWGVCVAFSILASISAIVLFGHLQSIFGAGSSGFMKAIGSVAGITQLSRIRRRSGRRRNHGKDEPAHHDGKPDDDPKESLGSRRRTTSPNNPRPRANSPAPSRGPRGGRPSGAQAPAGPGGSPNAAPHAHDKPNENTAKTRTPQLRPVPRAGHRQPIPAGASRYAIPDGQEAPPPKPLPRFIDNFGYDAYPNRRLPTASSTRANQPRRKPSKPIPSAPHILDKKTSRNKPNRKGRHSS